MNDTTRKECFELGREVAFLDSSPALEAFLAGYRESRLKRAEAVRDGLRQKEKTVTLTNQEIIELGYYVKEMTELIEENDIKLVYEEQKHCCGSVFHLVGGLLKNFIDIEYLNKHERVRDFYQERLSGESEKPLPLNTGEENPF